MDHIAPARFRLDSRSHRHQQYTLTQRASLRRANPYQEGDPADKPFREHKRRTTMSNAHRRFHRRAIPAEGTGSNIKTVNVEVVATVDTAGNVVAQVTVTQPDSVVPTGPSQALPDTSDVSAPVAAVESAVPTAPAAATDAAASTPEVPSIASLPLETQLAAPSTPTEPSQASIPSVPAEPTVAAIAALPSVPSVPAVPSVSLPSVPSVPAFPSDLTVPAYPYASSVGAIAAEAIAASSSASNATVSSEPSVVAALTAAAASSSTISTSTISSISSTSSITSSILASSPTLLSTMSGFTHSSPSVVNAASATAISSRGATGSSQADSSPSTTVSSNRGTPTESLDAAGSSSFYGSGSPGSAEGSGSVTAAAPAGTTAGAAGDSSDPTPLDTPQVVGSVVGSLAGAALILAIILMLLRRHKRRQGGALQLTDSQPTENEQQSMRQVQVQAPARPARASLVPSAFLNRFSGLSKSTAETSSPTERSFQRVSGRKLPSAFSEGMTSDQVARGGHMSGMTESSFYTDDQGTYGGPGLNKEYGEGFGKEIGGNPFAGGAGSMNFRPSPARTPIIHHPNENPFDDTNQTLSPPMSPNPFSSPADLSPRAALGRTLHSADGSRSSRFTENV